MHYLWDYEWADIRLSFARVVGPGIGGYEVILCDITGTGMGWGDMKRSYLCLLGLRRADRSYLLHKLWD